MMKSRLTFLVVLLIALLLPPLVERVYPAALPPRPTLLNVTCDDRRCTVQWRLSGAGRIGAALIAPQAGELLDDTTAASGVQTTVIERDDWRPGQWLQVLEWGDGWERRTDWVPTKTYLPRLTR